MSDANQDRLLAKSWRSDDGAVPASATLPGHLADVFRAAQGILDATGDQQLQAMQLDPSQWRDPLRRVVRLAAAVHDLGKCNSQFQKMLGERDPAQRGRIQTLRHEWVSLLILDGLQSAGFGGWRGWLEPALEGEREWQMLRWCVSGHHPKYGRSAPPVPEEGLAKMKVPLDHPDLRAAAAWIAETFGLEGDPPMPEPPTLGLDFAFDGNGDVALDELAERYWNDQDAFEHFDDDTRRLLAAAKNTLIAADVAGSALPRQAGTAEWQRGWVAERLTRALPDADVFQKIAEDRLQGRESDPGREGFQQRVAAADRRVTLVSAGCGTGKTVAAYRWAHQRCVGRRLFVCYPTTGTALEGFRDYMADPTLPSDLVTSRREVDLRMDALVLDAGEAVARIESLDLWERPIVACTCDAVLGVIQNNRRGLFGWPVIAQAGVVFDEIHSYDDKLFDALLHFLSTMRGVPVLLMTASLQRRRLEVLQELLGDELQRVAGPEELEAVRRCRREPVKDADAARERIVEELRGGGRVLRVCNTVRAAMDEADALAAALAEAGVECEPLIYHSRFRYLDRRERHNDVIAAFSPEKKGPALSITTQVCEMSLDLSATLLVTDRAPVPSLIQRLGRLNRFAIEDDPWPFIVVDPVGTDGKFSPLPYDADDLEAANDWLTRLETVEGDGLSQRELAETWEAIEAGADEAKGEDDVEPAKVPRYASGWLDFGPDTPVLELREGSPGITVVLERDLSGLRRGVHTLAEVAVPMPLPPRKVDGEPFDWQFGEHRGVPVAREVAVGYDERKGATWHG